MKSLFLLGFIVLFGTCTTELRTGKCFAYREVIETTNDVVISQCWFVGLHSSSAEILRGGGACIQGAAAVRIDSTTAYNCSVRKVTNERTWGGAFFVNSAGAIAISASCANECFAVTGQFGCIWSSLLTGHSVNSSTMLRCGNPPSILEAQSDGIDIEDVNATLQNLNATSCSCISIGIAIDAFGTNGCFSAMYMTVAQCQGVTIVHLYSGPLRPVIQFSNFYMNNARSREGQNDAYGVVYANDYGMIIRNCIFQEETVIIRLCKYSNNHDPIPFQVYDCVIGGTLPGGTQAMYIECSFGTTATLALDANDVVCVHDPCPTRSMSPTGSSSPPMSTNPVTETPRASTPMRTRTAPPTASPTNTFTPSSPVTPSHPLSASNRVPESRKFNGSSAFTLSPEVIGSRKFALSSPLVASARSGSPSRFAPSIQFTPSIRLNRSKRLITSPESAPSGASEESDDFSPSRRLRLSSYFAQSTRFAPTGLDFQSRRFASTSQCSPSGQFAQSSHFTPSRGFPPTGHITPSSGFAQSTRFASSGGFSPSGRFTESGALNESREFSDSEQFTDSWPIGETWALYFSRLASSKSSDSSPVGPMPATLRDPISAPEVPVLPRPTGSDEARGSGWITKIVLPIVGGAVIILAIALLLFFLLHHRRAPPASEEPKLPNVLPQEPVAIFTGDEGFTGEFQNPDSGPGEQWESLGGDDTL